MVQQSRQSRDPICVGVEWKCKYASFSLLDPISAASTQLFRERRRKRKAYLEESAPRRQRSGSSLSHDGRDQEALPLSQSPPKLHQISLLAVVLMDELAKPAAAAAKTSPIAKSRLSPAQREWGQGRRHGGAVQAGATTRGGGGEGRFLAFVEG